jgi:hypothetical protein
MQLLPAELREQIPKLYSQEKVNTQDKIVYAKFFFPAADWTWFVTEGEDEGDDFVFFGFVKGFEEEWGYFTLNELQSINIQLLKVERDLHFKPDKFSKVMAQFRKEREVSVS